MRRLFEVMVGPLLDLRARRAIEETLFDWSHEAQLAGDPLARLSCHARAMVALARTAASIILSEIAGLPTNTVWLRIGLWFLLPFPLVLYADGWLRFSHASQASAGLQLMLALLLLPTWSMLFGPLAFFLGALQRPRSAAARTPFLGVAVVSLALGLCVAGWIMPAANHTFRETVFEFNGGTGQLPRDLAELTLSELIAPSSPFIPRAVLVEQLNVRLSLVFTGPMVVILAAQLQRVRRRTRWLFGIGFLCASALAIMAIRSPGVARSLMMWFFPGSPLALAVLVGVAAARRSADASA